MTLTIELTQEEAQRLHSEANRRGVRDEEVVRSLIDGLAHTQEIVDEPMPKNGAELVAYWKRHGLIGIWADREDIQDSAEYARQLRDKAYRRGWGSPD